MFETSEGFRHTCFITDTANDDTAAPGLRHRGRARVEDRVRTLKDCGLANLPFGSVVRNETWGALTLIAGALLAWTQMPCFDGTLAKAEPKTPRFRILRVAALLVRRGHGLVLRLDETWPWADALADAFPRLRGAIPEQPGPGVRPESHRAGRDEPELRATTPAPSRPHPVRQHPADDST